MEDDGERFPCCVWGWVFRSGQVSHFWKGFKCVCVFGIGFKSCLCMFLRCFESLL